MAAVMTEPLLSCRDLTFRYAKKAKPVFAGLDLTVAPGEAVLLMGPSGCGKSTLAYCLAGLYPAYAGYLEGELLLCGERLSAMPVSKRAGYVSILFQNPDNQFCMDRVDHEILFALENIHYAGDLNARMEALLDLVELREVKTAPIYTLSGGTKQKLALATALATQARLLILDEPLANLDPDACVMVTKLLQKLHAAGLALLVVDHKPTLWRPFVNRVILMGKDGRLSPQALDPAHLEDHRAEFDARGLFLDESWLRDVSPMGTVADAPPAVTAENLTLYHGKQKFLKDLCFSLPRGSITAVIGRNGSGKTTLFTALAGIGKTSGSLKADGSVGLVFQNPRFQFLTLSVREEITVTLGIAQPQAGQDEWNRQAETLLDEFGLLPWIDDSPYALSQGQQRRLALLSMLAGDRQILLLDEPTYAQNEKATRSVAFRVPFGARDIVFLLGTLSAIAAGLIFL